MIADKLFTLALVCIAAVEAKYPPVAPYIDIVMEKPSLADVLNATGQKSFTLAFVLGSAAGCQPKWGGTMNIDDPQIISKIREFQNLGGEVIVATGGAIGPYLEHLCTSVDSLANAYITILDTVKTNYIDVDIEATVPIDTVTQALAKVQRERGTSVSFTLMVQGDEYGLTDILGVEVLKAAKKNKLKVDIVNPMTMEFGSNKATWGEGIISAAKATLKQMKNVWPEFNDGKLKRMLGITPMIGRNFNGKIFTQSDAKLLVNWAISNQIGLLAFWSVGRDNGGCPAGAVSPACSSIQQSDYEFTKLFKQFADTPKPEGDPTTEVIDSTDSSEANSTTVKPVATECTAKFESRFKEWCKQNCAVGFCPPDICECSNSLR